MKRVFILLWASLCCLFLEKRGVVSASDIALTTRQSDDKGIDYYDPYYESIQYEFDTWSLTIDRKLQKTIRTLDRDYTNYINDQIASFNATFTNELEALNATMSHDVSLICDHIKNISCTGKIDPETYEMVYYNDENEVISQYMTRPLINVVIRRSLNTMSGAVDKLTEEILLFHKGLQPALRDIQLEDIEVFEEWGESIITEWSERMALTDLMLNEDEIPVEHWKLFLHLKNSIVDHRDQLLHHHPNTMPLDGFLSLCNETLISLQQRHKATIQTLHSDANERFQAREEHDMTSQWSDS